jgi:hypothetical protein
LVPSNENITDKNIINPLGVPPHDAALDMYITYEPDLPIGTMMGRLHFKSKNRLSEYKKNMQLQKYLAREHMVIEEMRLNSNNPPIVGYFEDIIPDPDILRMHTVRIRKYLPPNHPRFQLFAKTLYNYKRHGTRVVMVKCDEENLETLREMFLALDEKVVKFFSWKEFTSLQPQLRETAFQKQVLFNKYYRSVVMSGFKDNDDNVTMMVKPTQTGQIDDTKDPLEDVYVTDYLQEWIYAGNGSNLFYHVYEPIDGKRDTIVHVDNLAEANDYAKVVLAELTRVMNTDAKTMVISNLQEAEAAAKNYKWKPYTKAAKLMEDRNRMNYFHNKRQRVDNKDTQQVSKKQTAKVNTNTEKPPPTNVWTQQPPPSVSATSKSDETMEEFEAQVQEQINKNNKLIRDEISDSNQATNKRIANLDKKLENHITSVQYDLHEIKEQNNDTKDSVKSNVDRLESIFWKMWSRFEDPPEEYDGMEYEKTRKEDALKRSLDQIAQNESSIDLSISQDDIPKQTNNLLQTQTSVSTHGAGTVN